MKKRLLLFCFTAVYASGFSQSYIANWNFNSIVNDALTSTGSLTPIIGTGTVATIGGTTSTFATGNTPDLNTTDNSGLNTTSYPSQGNAPKTAGVQFDIPTTGFNRAILEFYQRLSNTAANTWVLQYTLDKTGVSTGGSVVWTDAATYTFTPAATGTGDTWYYRTFDFSAISGLNNNANASFRIVSNFDPVTGVYQAARSTSAYSGGGTCRFDLVSLREAEGTASIAAANNNQIVSETVGTVTIPVTFANANNAPARVAFEMVGYSTATFGSDYNWVSNDTLVIPALFNGVVNFSLNVLNDTDAEKAETVILKIKTAKNAIVSTTNYYQIIYIKDNDYQAPVATNELNMSLLTSFSNGTAGTNSAEIVAYDSSNYRLYIVNSIGAKLDIVDFSNPSVPVLLNSVSVTPYGNINSVAVHNGVVALAIENANAQLNGSIVFVDQNGNFISQVAAGAMPDMITFNKDFTKVLTANEGEPNSTYSSDPEGSVTIVDLTPGYAALTNANATTIALTQYNGQETLLRSQGIRVFSTSASVAQDLEPEYIAISDDNSKAYVSLQENNAMLVIDLLTLQIDTIRALGYSNYSSGNAMDASDQTGQILITSLPVKGAYMPDAISYATINGQGYVFSANEGDSREFGSVVDANRISTLTLDPTVFTDQAILKNNRFAGRLNGLKYSGDTDNDGDLDEIHVMGGRSFSIWNAATGALVFDSKDLIEQVVANHPTFGAIFNASNSTGAPSLKNRSDDKGPEPEGITTAVINGENYLFVSLERVGGAMIFNINNPVSPVFIGYYNNRSTTASGPDLGAEGMIYISAEASPNGNSLVILANEVSSTLSIYQLNTCLEVANADLINGQNAICSGDTSVLSITGSSSNSIQWFYNNQPINGETGNALNALNAGEYQLFVSNAAYACSDTTEAFDLSLNQLPIVQAVASDVEVCFGDTVVLNGQGAETYLWTNGVTDQVAFTPSLTAYYVVIGTDTNNCSSADTLTVFVNSLPIVQANVNQPVICNGESVIFSGVGAQTYTWNNGIINGLSTLINSTDTFTVFGTDFNGCVSSDTVSVVVNEVPVISLGNDTTVCENQLPLTLNGPTGFNAYAWNTNETTSTIDVNQGGNYELTVDDANGCSGSSIITITVDACLSVEEMQEVVSVYPNPTEGMVVMNNLQLIGAKTIIVIDAFGKTLSSINVSMDETIIDLSNYSNGVYFVQVYTEDQMILKKLLKE
jgi:hypothetical protein